MLFDVAGNDKYLRFLPWIFTISFILITFLPRSLDETMFMDGVTYAAIARNMSVGIGSFWKPYFADSFWLPYDNGTFFSGHPPLQFGIQSILFRIMGDTIAVENIYDLLILVCHIVLIAKIWQKLFDGQHVLQRYAWLPVLCWYGMVTVWYSIPNNFLDSTMGVFCLLSCYFQLIFLKKSIISKKHYIWPLLAGFGIFLAFLTKGPVGLYPLAFTMLYSFLDEDISFQKALKSTGVMLGTAIVAGGLILTYQPAFEFLNTYFQGQVVQALLQKREKTGVGWQAHFLLIPDLLSNIYPHLLALIGLNILAFLLKLKRSISPIVLNVSQFAFLVAFSGIAPMLVSVKQYPHYLLPALPFVALFFATLFVEKTDALAKLAPKLSVLFFAVAIVGCWGITLKKVTSIQPDVMAENAKDVKKYAARASTIGVCHDLYQNADIHSYFQRYHLLSLTDIAIGPDTSRYILANADCLPQFDAKKDSIITLHGNFYLVIRNAQTARY
ncbi:ArnT family glycosyltransferase [Dyadobacter pollutisoli]|uniref:Glycosyltransferase family 39 protein n=1 Tax=Dyadobacter pollutisoli TaxID=2910158 RepID=A0A9E8SJL6_9BACT|nr:glycosyltransferase family 39 protein [Dyadobacter pollutisoli]WAC10983.1 glycosyltransferase family 39 protein [Dyadobacter pollutisoli]